MQINRKKKGREQKLCQLPENHELCTPLSTVTTDLTLLPYHKRQKSLLCCVTSAFTKLNTRACSDVLVS